MVPVMPLPKVLMVGVVEVLAGQMVKAGMGLLAHLDTATLTGVGVPARRLPIMSMGG